VLKPVRVWASRAVSVIAPSAAPPVPLERSVAPSPIEMMGAVSEIFPPAASIKRFGATVMLAGSAKT